MRFCITIVICAWPHIATAALFSKKKKNAEVAPTPAGGSDIDKLSERLRSMETKFDYVGDDIHEVVHRVDSVREGVQDVDWVISNMNESLLRMEEHLSQIQAESVLSKREIGMETQKLLDSVEKEQGRASSDINLKLDAMTRNMETLSESVARVHHLLAVGSVINAKANTITLTSPGGPPAPPPPPPPFIPPPPPLTFSKKPSGSGSDKDEKADGFDAVLNQIRSSPPQKRLRKTGSKFAVVSSDTSATTTDADLSSDSD